MIKICETFGDMQDFYCYSLRFFLAPEEWLKTIFSRRNEINTYLQGETKRLQRENPLTTTDACKLWLLHVLWAAWNARHVAWVWQWFQMVQLLLDQISWNFILFDWSPEYIYFLQTMQLFRIAFKPFTRLKFCTVFDIKLGVRFYYARLRQMNFTYIWKP